MPKPIFGINGSGMHSNISLFKDGKNAFYDPDGELELSETAYQFLAGILKHAPSFTAVTNPTVNSYKRLVQGYEAPVYVAWSGKNRSPLVRIPASRGMSTRLELRSVDPSANPYLAMAVILKAGLEGIKNQLTPPAPVDRNIYVMTREERLAAGIVDLPGTLKEALDKLQEDEIILSALGEHIAGHFIEAKEIEWNMFRTQITQWELDQYLKAY